MQGADAAFWQYSGSNSCSSANGGCRIAIDEFQHSPGQSHLDF
jgi:hypothetical protein